VLFGYLLEKQAAERPDTVVAIFGDTRLTYRDLDTRVAACAKALLANGIAKGDRIALLGSPRPEFMVVFLASARIGAIWVGLNPVQQLDEYRHILADCRPSLLFGFAQARGRDNRAMLDTLTKEHGFIRRTVLLDDVEPPGSSYGSFIATGEIVSDRALRERTESLSPDDGALIVYTSGSTGKPKGAVLTQANIAYSARLYCDLWPLDPLRVICNLPITHIACCVETVAYALAAGGSVVFQEQFDATDYLAAIERERVSWTPLVPTMFQRILSLPDWRRYDTSSLHVILFGGAAMPANMIEELKSLSPGLVGCWGMTETTSGVTFTDARDSIEILSSSVGRPAPGIEVSLMASDGTILDGDGPGEIVVRGPCVFKGYFGQDQATRDTIDRDGRLHSGDLGRRDAEGRLYIVGRIKEMFKSGGYNVYPREVEIAIETHPAISMAVVVPVPDPTYQEVGFAYVLHQSDENLTAETVMAYCRNRLANYKVPKRIFIRDSLPMLANGKIDRTALQKQALAAAEGRAP
jgi:acyl-CoA synthetase (AMP-forming)/AMP-acid ligase II